MIMLFWQRVKFCNFWTTFSPVTDFTPLSPTFHKSFIIFYIWLLNFSLLSQVKAIQNAQKHVVKNGKFGNKVE